MADFNMDAAVAEVGSGLDLGGNDDTGLAGGEPNSGGNDPSGDLGKPADPGSVLDGNAAGGDQAKPDGEVDPTADPGQQQPVSSFVPPKTWTPAAAAKLAAADPLIQAEVAKREEDMFRGIEGYKQDANLGKTFHNIVAPYMPLLTHFKVDAAQLIPNLLEAHKTLSLGTADQKLAYFRQLASDYGIPLEQAAAEAPYIDPEVRRLQQENQRLQSERQREHQQASEHARSSAASVLDAFIADPKNIYFDEVGNDIAALLQGGVCKTLQEAYDKAVWANPVTRAKEVTRTTAEKAAKDSAEAAARAEAARKATAANVRGSAKNASGTAALGSMDDTITSQLRAIRART